MTKASSTKATGHSSTPGNSSQQDRKTRKLSPEQRSVRTWIKLHYGVLSEIARETEKSVAFVQRIAYNREAQSRGFIVERKLKARGCPLIQKIDG